MRGVDLVVGRSQKRIVGKPVRPATVVWLAVMHPLLITWSLAILFLALAPSARSYLAADR